MTPAFDKFLIVNADDFGLSPGVNRGIVRAYEDGIVTSASLMVRQPGAAGAADYAKRNPSLSVGLHLDLGEWVFRGGEWSALYQVVPPDDAGAVRDEAACQLETFLRLLGRPPTHVDSHQHAHRAEPLLGIAQSMAEQLRVPLRHFTPGVRYCGDFYGQGGKGDPLPQLITPAALVDAISALPPGVTELACHPGEDPTLNSPYRDERTAEVGALCHPTVRAAIEEHGVKLVSFLDLEKLR